MVPLYLGGYMIEASNVSSKKLFFIALLSISSIVCVPEVKHKKSLGTKVLENLPDVLQDTAMIGIFSSYLYYINIVDPHFVRRPRPHDTADKVAEYATPAFKRFNNGISLFFIFIALWDLYDAFFDDSKVKPKANPL